MAGRLTVGDLDLRLVFNVRHGEGKAVEATLDSPDQGAIGLPVTTVESNGEVVRFDIKVLAAVYTGKLGGDGSSLVGEWHQSGQVLPLELEKEE